jgi:hypothetical protein
MRTAYRSLLSFFLFCCPMAVAAQTVTAGFQFPTDIKPGGSATIPGAGLGGVTAVTLKAAGKTDLPATNVNATATAVTFTVPATASGTYQVVLSPGSISPIPLTVTPGPAVGTPAATEKPPVIDSVFPTTTYPIQNRFNFEVDGQRFDADPNNDQIEVDGQGLIKFGSRYRSPAPGTERKAGGPPIECAQESQKFPCLEATQDGRRLSIFGFPRRHAYQGPLRVRVSVKDVPTEFSSYFTLSRVDHRIIVWLTFVVFALLMYIVYRLVSKGIQGYMIAGRKYSPLAAFLIDKTTDTYSLSKFQLFALSGVAFFGYVYVCLCRALVQWNFTFPEIPDNYPSLLAISVGTTAAAVGLNSARGTKGAGPVYPSPADFISNGGLVVAERYQFFVWTLIACVGFIALILMQDPAKVDGFPTFPSGLLYVMGVSAGGYLGGKAVRKPGPILKQVKVGAVAANGLDLSFTLLGENLDSNGKFRIDGALQTPVVPVTGPPQPQAPPGYSTQLEVTLSQAAAGSAHGDHVFEIINGDGIGAQAIFTKTPMQITHATAIAHGGQGQVTLTVIDYREGSSARWLAPGASVPVEIPAAEVNKTPPPAAGAAGGAAAGGAAAGGAAAGGAAAGGAAAGGAAVGGAPPPAVDTVVVTVSPGDKAGTGTLTLVSPLGGTEATSVTVT